MRITRALLLAVALGAAVPGVAAAADRKACLSTEEPISSIPFAVDSQTGYAPLLKGIVRAPTDCACIPLLNLLVLDSAQVQPNAREWTWSRRGR